MRENPSTLKRHLSITSPGIRERKMVHPPSSIVNVPVLSDSAVRFSSDSSFSSESGDDKPKKEKNSVSFLSLFRYATQLEWLLMMLGLVTSSLAGATMPFEVILYGEFTSLLVYRKSDDTRFDDTLIIHLFGGGKHLSSSATQDDKNAALVEDSVAFGLACVAVASLQFFLAIWGVNIFNYTAARQITRIRKMYLQSVLRQEMAWFDTNVSDNLASGLTENLEKMKEGMAEKVSMFVFMLMAFVSTVVISFIYGWKLTLFVIMCTPIICASTAVVAKLQSILTKKELRAYGTAGHVAEEVLSAVRTVITFGGEKKEVQRYSKLLMPAKELGVKKGLISGVGTGVVWFVIYLNYALSFWYGISLILDHKYDTNPEYTPAVLIIVLFGVLAGAEQLGLTAPLLETFAAAMGAAHAVFLVVERPSSIDSLGDSGVKPDAIDRSIRFFQVGFHYPSRPEVPVLQDLTLEISKGETVALVGASGCGKSTCVQLLQRLYDPVSGLITIDGLPIRLMNIKWLRKQIGVVGQEPALFSMTIEENIRYGNPNATLDQIENAAKTAYCHDFIRKLPDGYETLVGEHGAQLSGGQKQRIAIARALVGDPKILLMDEATSALDLQSEAKVQKALERAAQGRTTIIVAHRLSTIKQANRIVYLEGGTISEMGTHAELMNQRGKYFQLVMAEEPDPPKAVIARRNKSKQSTEERELSKDLLVYDDDSDSEEEFKSTTIEEKEEITKQISIWTLLRYNKKEWHILAIATLSAFLIGGSFPAFAIIFGEFYGLLSGSNDEYIRSEILTYAVWFIVVGVITALGTFFQTYLYSRAGAALTKRLRIASFEAMLNQEVAWFDKKINSVGALAMRLAADCNSVQGATGIRIGALVQALATMILGVALSLYYTWKMTLVSLTSVPIVLGAVLLEARVMDVESVKEKEAMEASSKIASEAIMNIRTIAGLCAETPVMERYNQVMIKANEAASVRVRFRGVVFALGQSVPFAGYAVSLYYGGVLAAHDEVHYKNVIKVSEALIFGAWMMGQALAFAPNFQSAILSAGRIFGLIRRQPCITSPPEAKLLADFAVKGDVSYETVEFSYPTRPETPVLKSLYLDIPAGKTIALVGQSGCGKSTVVQLLQRLYDTDAGKIMLDGMQINRDYTLSKLRSQMGTVSQEPVLFNKTIAENIAYGDNDRVVPMEEIIQVAKEANIHDFIISLPKGYETNLGTKGAQLSGGQKQRIAIARALVRNPRILLLDEATSALDMESEKVVSEALDRARSGRTCVIIAHRLASVRRADLIAVVADGKIAELGTPDELLQKDGLYAQLHALQERSSV